MTKADVLKHINSEVEYSGVRNTPVSIQDIIEEMKSSANIIHPIIDELVSEQKLEYCGIGSFNVRLT